ncbi:unnamed protein product [Mytilus edulis]|uniref:DZIP3-like HEPN domain-containing protein n=1 Tax=Mytilus edulis TaxID=6550 RepID=A0A8S3QSI2_MYTED|nr:unnamed protein product [Mytilus edulis]
MYHLYLLWFIEINLSFYRCSKVKYLDITLIITLLRNLTELNPPHLGFDCLPATNEITPASDLARIKYYRNYLAHLDDAKIHDTFFISAWEDISEAIGRLGGQSLKQECDQLRTKILDQTNKEIILEIKHSKDEIEELKQSLETLNISHKQDQAKNIANNRYVICYRSFLRLFKSEATLLKISPDDINDKNVPITTSTANCTNHQHQMRTATKIIGKILNINLSYMQLQK